jgi:hypothetical protein
MMVPASV